MSSRNNENQIVIAVHGGAWAVPEALWDKSINGVIQAVKKGYEVLKIGGSALDSVESAIELLENNPVFDAGKGSVLTPDGEVEMSALIMDGSNLKAGSVAAIKNIANPVKVARLVLEKTPHVLLVGEGANKFAEACGVKKVPSEELVTEYARSELEKYIKFKSAITGLYNDSLHSFNDDSQHDTVGCVAKDSEGHLACATSTGGITAKMPGRVGDSPIIGAGGIADDATGAVSTTGNGEAIAKTSLAKEILHQLEMNRPSNVTDCIKTSLNIMKDKVKGNGGAIVITKDGQVGAEFTTERMVWAYIILNDEVEAELHYGLHPKQHEIKLLSEL